MADGRPTSSRRLLIARVPCVFHARVACAPVRTCFCGTWARLLDALWRKRRCHTAKAVCHRTLTAELGHTTETSFLYDVYGSALLSPEMATYCTVLYCTLLYSTLLYCATLYCTVLYCTVLYCTVLYCTVLYCATLYCTVLYCS